MNSTSLKAHYIKVAGVVALVGNAVLAAVKFLFAYLSGSLAVAGDAIDSSTDVLIALVTLFVSRIIQQPGDKEHPWGHARAETTATMALAFIIFFAGAQIVLSAAKKIILHDFHGKDTIFVLILILLIRFGCALKSKINSRNDCMYSDENGEEADADLTDAIIWSVNTLSDAAVDTVWNSIDSCMNNAADKSSYARIMTEIGRASCRERV